MGCAKMFDVRKGGETETVGTWEIGLQPGSISGPCRGRQVLLYLLS